MGKQFVQVSSDTFARSPWNLMRLVFLIYSDWMRLKPGFCRVFATVCNSLWSWQLWHKVYRTSAAHSPRCPCMDPNVQAHCQILSIQQCWVYWTSHLFRWHRLIGCNYTYIIDYIDSIFWYVHVTCVHVRYIVEESVPPCHASAHLVRENLRLICRSHQCDKRCFLVSVAWAAHSLHLKICDEKLHCFEWSHWISICQCVVSTIWIFLDLSIQLLLARLPNTRKIMEVWYCFCLQVARAGSNFFLHSFFDTISQALTENGMKTGSFPSSLLWCGFLEMRV